MPQSASAPTSLVLVTLNDNNTGMHPIVGVASRQAYGYRAHGEKFYILPEDNVPAMHVLPVVAAAPEPEVATIAEQEAVAPEPVSRKKKVH